MAPTPYSPYEIINYPRIDNKIARIVDGASFFFVTFTNTTTRKFKVANENLYSLEASSSVSCCNKI